MATDRDAVLKFLLDDSLERKVKLSTVSGIFTTKPNLIRWADNNIPELDIITTKSYQVRPNSGNRPPIIAEIASPGCFVNAVGLKNPGMEQGYADLAELRQNGLRALLNVSLSANSTEDFIILAKHFEGIADILELNFSCPHAATGFGSSIGSSAELVSRYLSEIRKSTSALLFPKLTPNVDDIGLIARAAIDAGADGISAINTVGPHKFYDHHTRKPILSNPKGQRGGQSGEWIKVFALDKIQEIRGAIGPDYPIIGMGGVSTGEDVANMIEAGADIVGLGTVLARVKQSDMPLFFRLVREDAEAILKGDDSQSDRASTMLSNKRIAEYNPFLIRRIEQKTPDLRKIVLDGAMDYEASQFAFLWVPGVGESPFSIADNDPLTFVVRRREYDAEKGKGLVTDALFKLSEGDNMMVRGVYGAEAPTCKSSSHAYVVAGGTGIAVVPGLVKKLSEEGKKITVFYGVSDQNEALLTEEISAYAKIVTVADEGELGRVLKAMKSSLISESEYDSSRLEKSCFYNVGPSILMGKAMSIQESLGANPKNIFSSLETMTMCGVGLCGECECGGKLLCKEGTFVSLEYLQKNEIDVTRLKG